MGLGWKATAIGAALAVAALGWWWGGGSVREVDVDPGNVFAEDPILRLLRTGEPPSEKALHLSEADVLRDGTEVFVATGGVDPATREIWALPSGSTVWVRYGGDVVVTGERWSTDQDPAAVYDDQFKHYDVGYLTTIAEHPAWVVPADAQSEGHPPVNRISVAIGGWSLTIFGRFDLDDLVAFAASLERLSVDETSLAS